MLHDVEVPQLHDLLLPLVDVGELLDLLQREQSFQDTLGPPAAVAVTTAQAFGVAVTLLICVPWRSSLSASLGPSRPRCPRPSPEAAAAHSCRCGSRGGCVR